MSKFKNPFLIDVKSQTWEYGVRIWTTPILDSLRAINEAFDAGEGLILDVAGGNAPFKTLVNQESFTYIVMDINPQALPRAQENVLCIVAAAERMPLREASVDVVLACSCLQYFDQNAFFRECSRVLKTNGILAIHENGAYNPIILAARLAQRAIGLFDKKSWNYRNSIRKYYRPRDILGFNRISTKHHGFLSSALFCVQFLGLQISPRFQRAFSRIDEVLFKLIPITKKLAFLNVVHYRRCSLGKGVVTSPHSKPYSERKRVGAS